MVVPKPLRLRAPRGGIVVDGRHYPGGRFLPASAGPALEGLAARAARRSTAEPVVVGIHGFDYSVRSIPVAPCIGSHGFELVDAARGRLYHVHRSDAGEVCCDCPDFEFRKRGLKIPCKHGAALIALGLIATRPTTLAPFAQRAAAEAPAADHINRALDMVEVPTAAAVAGFERWAADQMAGVKGECPTPSLTTPAETWRRRGERLGRSGRLVDLELAYPDATPREVLLHALDFGEGQHFGFRDFARQLGYAAGLDGGPGDRPATIPRRFDDAWLAGFEEGSAERRERDRIQAEWQREAEEEEMERWAREEAAEAGGYYRAALARA